MYLCMSDEVERNELSAAANDPNLREHAVMALVMELVRELHPHRLPFIEVQPASRIDRDLGIDSLARTELILRLERAFRVRLGPKTAVEAETVHDLVLALQQVGPGPRSDLLGGATVALPSAPAARDAKTLLEVLDWHAAHRPDRLHLTILQDEATVVATLTYAELAVRAREVARGLIARDVSVRDRVALMLPTSVDFFTAFFGILYAGAIPVPIYPPMRLSQLEDHLNRQSGILRNAGACLLITLPEEQRLAGLLRAKVETLEAIESVATLRSLDRTSGLPSIRDPDAIALIQYTSGSTGDPKGVVLSHANLLANIRAMGGVMDARSTDVFVSWLPLYHDMGLIGAWLGCLHFAAPLYAMSPLSFLVRPASWLWAVHRFRATFSASPNFGFELCLNKVADTDIVGLDLSSLRMVANGAEPVSVQTMRRFIDGFGSYGFPAHAMAPVYGLAESSVGLAFPPRGREPLVDRVDRLQLSVYGKAEPARADDPKPLELVACGQPLPGHEIRIVDEIGFELGERQEGSLQFRGPSATRGYFMNEVKSRDLFSDGWLVSGDRGYIAGGDVYITGRIKDIIIRAGRHLYPQEIEEAVANVVGIRKGGVVVFGTTDRASGTERVVIVAETRETDQLVLAQLGAAAHEAATAISGTPPDDVVLVPPRTVPKTSSGKVRRSAAKQLYESGTLGASEGSLRWQVARLALGSVVPQARRVSRELAEIVYAVWWWLIVAAGFLIGSVAVLALPRLDWRWLALRRICRGVLGAMGTSASVTGIARIPAGGAVLTFNHSSYMDALVLAAVLPGEPAIIAKRELSSQAFAGLLLRRLGIPFVERYDVSAGLVDAQALIDVARQGRTLVFFPEGTFTRRAGLSEFYLGAFTVAALADVPVLPGVIRGTRTLLRADQWFPRRAKIAVEICEPLAPSGADFDAVLRLRNGVRDVILANCGEPDLAELVKPAAPHPTAAPRL